LFPLLGSYIPFAVTRTLAAAAGDPRRSIEERYRGREEYLQQAREAANALVKARYLLDGDVALVVRRAEDHWNLLMGQAANTGHRRTQKNTGHRRTQKNTGHRRTQKNTESVYFSVFGVGLSEYCVVPCFSVA
jgi:hypothetical protein